jgi:hypothetical protein
MNADELRQLIRNSTTRPVKIYADGKEFLIPHPEFAHITGPWTGSGQTLIISRKDEVGYDMLDISLITRVEILTPSPGPVP